MSSDTLKTAWRRQQQWSAIANRYKGLLTQWRIIVLSLVTSAAVCGTSSGAVEADGARTALGILAAVAAACAPILSKQLLGQRSTARWVRARSASEAFKAEIFRYRTRTGVYSKDDATQTLSAESKKISESVADLADVQMPDIEIDAAELGELSIDGYVEHRVRDQIDYYGTRARDHSATAERYRNLHLLLMLVAAVMGTVSAFVDVQLGPWVAVVTTATAGLIAHASAGRHDELAIAFSATGNRLQEAVDLWTDRPAKSKPTPEERNEFVQTCEAAISSENQSWHAKLSEPPPRDA